MNRAGHGRLAHRAGCIGLAVAAWVGPAQAVPAFSEVRTAHLPSDLTLLDRHGEPIQTLRIDKTVRRLAWVPLQEMSPALLQAIVLSEDRSFYQHSGVDWAAAARSAWRNLWNTRTRGASTLTMQLAGLLDDELTRPTGGRSVGQKLSQALTARQLEARWKKSEILEAYLNRVAWRGELVGIGALSQALFGKHASGLDQQEAAIAAALVRGPNAAPAVVAQRACGVLKLQGAGCIGVTALAETALARRQGMPLGEQLAPHAARQLKAATIGGPVRTTLDATLQRIAVASLRSQLAELSGRHVEDGAVLVLDNRSGEVLAWVGSSGSLSDAAQVDGVLARRQPGSTLKPFVYELAFERRLITPASLLDDSPAQLATAAGVYAPQNYDRQFKGWVSARTALGASLNVPAVRVAAMLPPDALFNRLNAFGLALSESGGYHGHALALGGADVSLLALTNAYRALANAGWYTPVAPLRLSQGVGAASANGDGRGVAVERPGRRLTDAEPARRLADAPPASRIADGSPGRRVADSAAVYLVTDILSDNNARVRTFGFDSALATHGHAAVKTGTSKDMRDNWCIGYTDRYTVGVWVGNASGEAMHDVSGVSGAAPVWRTLVMALQGGQPSQPPPLPPGVVSQPLVYAGAGPDRPGVESAGPHRPGMEAARSEVFLAGTERSVLRAGTQVGTAGGGGARFGIQQPREGSIFALDPDIPPAAQQIAFEGEAGTWVLDGKAVGAGSRWHWAPWPGRHRLSLVGRDGRTLQTVGFEVRGAAVKVAKADRPRR